MTPLQHLVGLLALSDAALVETVRVHRAEALSMELLKREEEAQLLEAYRVGARDMAARLRHLAVDVTALAELVTPRTAPDLAGRCEACGRMHDCHWHKPDCAHPDRHKFIATRPPAERSEVGRTYRNGESFTVTHRTVVDLLDDGTRCAEESVTSEASRA